MNPLFALSRSCWNSALITAKQLQIQERGSAWRNTVRLAGLLARPARPSARNMRPACTRSDPLESDLFRTTQLSKSYSVWPIPSQAETAALLMEKESSSRRGNAHKNDCVTISDPDDPNNIPDVGGDNQQGLCDTPIITCLSAFLQLLRSLWRRAVKPVDVPVPPPLKGMTSEFDHRHTWPLGDKKSRWLCEKVMWMWRYVCCSWRLSDLRWQRT